jgi:hypothetical protein
VDRNTHLGDWFAAAQSAGLVEPDCAFEEWLDGREEYPASTLDDAPSAVALEACMSALRLPQNTDRAFFIALVDQHSTSEAVKRWARNG